MMQYSRGMSALFGRSIRECGMKSLVVGRGGGAPAVVAAAIAGKSYSFSTTTTPSIQTSKQRYPIPISPCHRHRRYLSTTPPLSTSDSSTPTGIPPSQYATVSIKDMMSLKDKVTVITGGARGIGLGLAYAVAQSGGDIAVLDSLDEPHPDFWELEKKFGVKVKLYKTDVTDIARLTETFDNVVNDFGHIDSCITAAGIVLDKPFLEHKWDETAKIQMVNSLGTFFSVQLAAKQMAKQGSGGSVVMIASIAGTCAIPTQRISGYGLSKGGVRILGQHLAVELAPHKIRVNTISPGYIATDMTARLAESDPDLLKVFTREPPLGRMGDRVDLMAGAVYLLSDASSYTTGTDLLVTGGLHAGRI